MKTLFKVTALTLGCSALLASFSALADLNRERALSLNKQLFESTTPGSLNSARRHAKGENARVVKDLIPALNNELILVRDTLSRELVAHRLGQETAIDLRYRIDEYNKLFDSLDYHSVVYDDASPMGAYGSSFRVLNEGVRSLGTIELTGFDFTSGFYVECQKRYNSGLVVHRNSKTGDITWRHRYSNALAVVGENPDGSPIIAIKYETGITSAFNAAAGRWESSAARYMHSNAAAYNEATEKVEFQESGYHSGLGGVFNPVSAKVEWSSAYHTGVAGYFEPTKAEVIWTKAYQSGRYHTSSGYYGYYGGSDD